MPITLTGDTGVESPELFLSVSTSVLSSTPAITINKSGTAHEVEMALYQNLDPDDLGFGFFTTLSGVKTETVRITPAGSVWLFGGGNVYAGDGSASSPSFTFNSGSNSGMYYSGTNQLAFSVGGTSRLRVNNSAPYVEYFDGSTWQELGAGGGGGFDTAGNGLTSSGTTVSLGTPSTITGSTTNSTTTTSHTHAVSLTASDVGAASSGISITAGNGLTGGGTLAATRTLTLGTPGNITYSTTNSVTSTSHTHAFVPTTTGNSLYTYLIAASTSHSNSTSYNAGTTVAGSTLVRYNVATSETIGLGGRTSASGWSVILTSGETSVGAAGTWRLMSWVRRGSSTSERPVGLWLRIS